MLIRCVTPSQNRSHKSQPEIVFLSILWIAVVVTSEPVCKLWSSNCLYYWVTITITISRPEITTFWGGAGMVVCTGWTAWSLQIEMSLPPLPLPLLLTNYTNIATGNIKKVVIAWYALTFILSYIILYSRHSIFKSRALLNLYH